MLTLFQFDIRFMISTLCGYWNEEGDFGCIVFYVFAPLNKKINILVFSNRNLFFFQTYIIPFCYTHYAVGPFIMCIKQKHKCCVLCES